MRPPIPADEALRLLALRECCVLDTQPEEGFDQITLMAAEIAAVPIALVSLVDATRQWFKSKVGLDACETSRDLAFCAHAIMRPEPLIVPDATQDPRFAENPLVVGPPGIRFYAGFPLELSTGERLGTLCVIDSTPRELTPQQIKLLTALSRQATSTLELRRACHQLEQSNTKRDDLIDELRVVQDELTAACHAKSQFLANMSHEIRTPMTAILGFLDLIVDPSASAADRSAHTETIRRNALQLLEIINGILDLSKIEAGKMTVESVATSPAAIVADVETLMRPRAEARGLAFTVSCDDSTPSRIRSDPVRVRQIVTNLVANAIKFTQTGSVAIEVSGHDASDAAHVRFVVEDTGIGIAADDLGRVFLPFEQADASTTRGYGGTGLGLRISKQLAGALGGSLTAESEPGRGSRFTLSLPLVEVATASDASIMPGRVAPEPDAAPAAPLTGVRVLVADDAKDNQCLLRFHMRRAGTEPTIVGDGVEAVEAVERAAAAGEPYDLLIIDMQMPRMDGYEAARTLRDAGHRLAIIALTAHAMVGAREECLAAGCDDYAVKPLDPPDLLRRCCETVATSKRSCV